MPNRIKQWWSGAQSARLSPTPGTQANVRTEDEIGSHSSSHDLSGTYAAQSHIHDPYGLFELANDPDTSTSVDVIAVHGLQGHPFATWTHDDGNLWLKDDLPGDVPSARILSFGYDSNIAFSRSVVTVEDIASQLLNDLYNEREKDEAIAAKRPIVFVCHSLGGIVVKKALVIAHERSSNAGFKDILENTRAIAFLGVPHQGSKSADFTHTLAYALKCASIGISTNTRLLASLKKNSPKLYDISEQFVERGKDLKIYTFYETLKMQGVQVCQSHSAFDMSLFIDDFNRLSISSLPESELQTKTLFLSKQIIGQSASYQGAI